MNAFTKWLDTLLDEKGIDLEETFEITAKGGTPNTFSYAVIVDAMKGTSPREQAAIKDTLVKIDFVNGDVRHFMRHLAGALAFDL